MQKITAFILLISIIGQSFNQGLYYLDYAIDRAAYEKKCINKARPELACKGKCQLMKRIAEKEQRELGDPPVMKLANKIEVISSRSFFTSSIAALTIDQPKNYILTNIGTPVDQPAKIFHPPNWV